MHRNSAQQRIFLLSPAHCGGRRAQMLVNETARFELATRLRESGATIGEIFAFLSGLYFRGKLAYSVAFARPPAGWPGALVITTNRGLVPPETAMTLTELRDLGTVSIEAAEPRYAGRSAATQHASPRSPTVRWCFLAASPVENMWIPSSRCLVIVFVFRPSSSVGHMSRGGLMLRCAASGQELDLCPGRRRNAGAVPGHQNSNRCADRRLLQ